MTCSPLDSKFLFSQAGRSKAWVEEGLPGWAGRFASQSCMALGLASLEHSCRDHVPDCCDAPAAWLSDGSRVCYRPPILTTFFPGLVTKPSVLYRLASQSASTLVTLTFPEAWGSHPFQELQFSPGTHCFANALQSWADMVWVLGSFVQGECQHPESGTVGGKQAVCVLGLWLAPLLMIREARRPETPP